jgi:signal transduction histidine kinase
MQMALHLLDRTVGDADRQHRYLQILRTECDREAELVLNLLDLQRIQSEDVEHYLLDSVDLHEWLPSLLEPWQSRAEERQQQMSLFLDPNLPTMLTHRFNLKRMLTELINNAYKYTPRQGQILIQVQPEVEPQDGLDDSDGSDGAQGKVRSNESDGSDGSDGAQGKVRSNGSDGSDGSDGAQGKVRSNESDGSDGSDGAQGKVRSQVKFTIRNTAEIPAAKLPYIFDKFYRIPVNHSWYQSGTGLGLSLVQKIVERMNGSISVTSDDGWTTFTVVIPTRAEAETPMMSHHRDRGRDRALEHASQSQTA